MSSSPGKTIEEVLGIVAAFLGILFGILFLLTTVVLTPTGFFTDHWALEMKHWKGVEGTAAILEYIAFWFITAPFVFACCIPCCTEDWCIGFLILLMIAFLLSAFFSFIGCMIHASLYSTSQLGYSFYLCLTPGAIVLLFIAVCIIAGCVVCILSKLNPAAISPSPSGNTTQPPTEQPGEHNLEVSAGEPPYGHM